jgi:hypothetical protein
VVAIEIHMDKLQEIGDSKVKKDEISILVDIQRSCGFDGWYNQEGWHEVETHPSGAYGVTISHGHVTSIRLGNNGLSGPLPESIGDLEYVEEVVMNFNQLTGVLPDSLTKCKNLKYLSLNNNQMEGPLPANCANWTQMWNLQVSTWSAGRRSHAGCPRPAAVLTLCLHMLRAAKLQPLHRAHHGGVRPAGAEVGQPRQQPIQRVNPRVHRAVHPPGGERARADLLRYQW